MIEQINPRTMTTRRNTTRKRDIKPYVWGSLFVLPEIIIFILFLWIPISKGIFYSFQDVDFIKGNHYIGLKNYADMFSSSAFLISIKNTLYYMFLCLLIGYCVPVIVALFVSELRRFQAFSRIAAYLPSVVPAIVLYGLWMWFYDPVGPINSFIRNIGLSNIQFFSKDMAMVSIVIMETWQSFGAAVLIYLASIISIPKDLYEAAEIDGAGVLQRVWHITLSSIKGLLALIFLMQIIKTAQAFQAQLTMTNGGPDNSTLTYMLLMTREAFTNLNFGKAAAMGVTMFSAMLIMSFIYVFVQKRSEQER